MKKLQLPWVLASVVLFGAVAPADAENRRPAILFCSPQGVAWGWLDLDYARQLHQAGFEVDWTEDLSEVTWERVKKYNVLVIYATPDSFDVTNRGMKPSPEKAKSFADLIDRYAAAGGGVLLMPTECNMLKQQVVDLTDRWGARLPVELIEEKDPAKRGHLTHASQQVPLAWTDQVLPSPVSAGVRQIWYPISPAYNAQQSGPVAVDEHWQVVVKGSKTTVTKPVDLAKSTMPVLENPFSRPGGVAEPAWFAIRAYKKGRIALVNQWRQFSVGSGTRYIFQRQVLTRGFGGRPSDFGRLLENTYRWLAEPSLQSAAVGGYATPAGRLVPPNADPKVRKEYADQFWPYDAAKLSAVEAPAHLRLFRGLIGAKTAFSTGRGTVADYAKAAVTAGLDFLVFMDDFEKLTPEKLRRLTAECRQSSSEKIKLFPGFSIRNNVGNRMFFFSPDPVWVPDYCLTGPDKRVLYIQEEDGKGNYTGYLTPFLDWVLNNYHVEKGQVGYYDFASSPHGMRMPNLRLYAMAAIRTYRQGRLVEDVTGAYLTTAQGTIPPAPASVNEVAAPEELLREVRAGHALVCAQARSLDTLFADALRWTHQYDGPNVFMSDGPKILAWPGCHRVWTLGAEEFVTGRSVMPAPLAVVSERGLKEICIYNGQQLFRRFLPEGAKEFRRTLVLDGTVQKNLVLVAEDLQGKRAISFARRCWKDGALAPSFCSDHVNDGTMALTHGPFSYSWIRNPALPTDVAGDTWDGGPTASLPLTGYQQTAPVLQSDKGTEDGARFDQVPLLEFSDEGALAVSSPRTELFDPKVSNVVNPWNTYGPIGGPSRLFEYTERYREYVPPTVGFPQTGWAAPGVRQGTNAALFLNEITFKEDLKIHSLRLGHTALKPAGRLVVGTGTSVQVRDPAQPGKDEAFRLDRGDWLGLFSPEPATSNLFVNRGEPLRMTRRGPLLEFDAEKENTQVKRGDRIVIEIAAIGFPIDVEIKTAEELRRFLEYLKSPQGLQVARGKRLDGPGLVELAPDADSAVELSVPKPASKMSFTLPCRIVGLNPRWSAGVFQKQGYVKGDYGSGENRYRALGLDLAGSAYLPLYVDRAPVTHVVAGHPVIAGPEAKDLFIQVTKVGQNPDRWHVSVNNPMDRPITTSLRRAMALPGLDLPDRPITLKPGEYVVLL